MSYRRVIKAKPEWKDVEGELEHSSCAGYHDYLVKNHGYTDGFVIGTIGYSSPMTHRLHTVYREEEDGSLSVSPHLSCYCGSGGIRTRIGLANVLGLPGEVGVTCRKCVASFFQK